MARVNSKLEYTTEQKGDQIAAGLGYLALKFTPAGQRGWPDKLYIGMFGVHVYVEYKREDHALRRLQAYRRGQLQARGVYAYGPVDTEKEIRNILERHKAEMGSSRLST